MLTVSEKNRPYFMRELEKSNARYSQEWKCPTGYLEKANYHTQLYHCQVHSTREAFTYANALLATGDDKDLARAVDSRGFNNLIGNSGRDICAHHNDVECVEH